MSNVARCRMQVKPERKPVFGPCPPSRRKETLRCTNAIRLFMQPVREEEGEEEGRAGMAWVERWQVSAPPRLKARACRAGKETMRAASSSRPTNRKRKPAECHAMPCPRPAPPCSNRGEVIQISMFVGAQVPKKMMQKQKLKAGVQWWWWSFRNKAGNG